MRLGFHYHTPALLSGGRIIMPSYLGLFIDSLADCCESVICFLHHPLPSEIESLNYTLRCTNVILVDIGPHSSIPKRTLNAWMNRKYFTQWETKLDVLLVRASTPLLPVIATVWKKPMVLLLVSDASNGIDNLPQPGWRKKIIKAYSNWYQGIQTWIAKRCLTFTNSQLIFDELHGKLLDLVLTRTTTLSQNDFHYRQDTCKDETIKLLYAGRMTRIKGLFEIVEAMVILKDQGFNVSIDLVGMIDPSDLMIDDLLSFAKSKGLVWLVVYHGSKTAGGDLLEFYRMADIYVIASKSSSEGFPRTIWEAMASSTPVVTTSVGSIPAYAGAACEIVPPKDVPALAKGIKKVISNPERRKQMIQLGMELAKGNTLEQRANEMIGKIEQWLNMHSNQAVNKS
jgi:glycosyltransferase involved in cell wall biosynthesis